MDKEVQKIVQEYILLRDRSQFDQALAILVKAIDVEPSNKILHNRLIEAYAIKGLLKDIARECVRYIDISMTNENLAEARRTAHMLVSLFNESEKALNKAMEVFERGGYQKEFIKTALTLSNVYTKKQKPLQVQYVLLKIMEMKLPDFAVRLQVAGNFASAGMEGQALTIYKEVLLDSLRMGDNSISDRAMAEIRSHVKNDLMIHFILGDVYRQMDELDLAATEYKEILRLDRGNMNAVKAIGAILYSQEKYDLAIKAFNKVIAANPEDTEATLGMAQSLIGIGDISGAIEYLHATSRIYQKYRKHTEAYKIYKKIVALDPNHRPAQREIKKAMPGSKLTATKPAPLKAMPLKAGTGGKKDDSAKKQGLIKGKQADGDAAQAGGLRLFKKIVTPPGAEEPLPSPEEPGMLQEPEESLSSAEALHESPEAIHYLPCDDSARDEESQQDVDQLQSVEPAPGFLQPDTDDTSETHIKSRNQDTPVEDEKPAPLARARKHSRKKDQGELPTEELLDCIIEKEGIELIECMYKDTFQEKPESLGLLEQKQPPANEESISLEQSPPEVVLDCIIENEGLEVHECINEYEDRESAEEPVETLETPETEGPEMELPEEFLFSPVSAAEAPAPVLEEIVPDDFFLNMILSETESDELLPGEALPMLDELKGSIESSGKIISIGVLTLEGDIIWNPLQIDMKVFAHINSFLRSFLQLKNPKMIPYQHIKNFILEGRESVSLISHLSAGTYLFIILRDIDEIDDVDTLLWKVSSYQRELQLLFS